jgi:hypothetical protein
MPFLMKHDLMTRLSRSKKSRGYHQTLFQSDGVRRLFGRAFWICSESSFHNCEIWMRDVSDEISYFNKP